MIDRKPLKLTVARWLVDDDQEAELALDTSAGLGMVEMALAWGPGPRQMRVYSLQESDLEELHDWLGSVLQRE